MRIYDDEGLERVENQIDALHRLDRTVEQEVELDRLLEAVARYDNPVLANSFCLHVSERNLPLVYTGPLPSAGVILTVENYGKWYDVYVVRPGGVGTLPNRYCRLYEKMHPGYCAMSDHIPSPGFCQFLGRLAGHEWDNRSLEMALGRWVREGRPQFTGEERDGEPLRIPGLTE